MATIKSYTNLEQSKRLAEFLPLESADMFYNEEPDETYRKDIVDTKYPMALREGQKHHLEEYGIPCWSLAALLELLPDNYIDVDDIIKHPSLMKTRDSHYMVIYSAFQYTSLYNNPVDACYEMILKLHELNLL